MKIEVHSLRYAGDWLIPYVVRHYLTYATKLVIHDGGGGRSLEDLPSKDNRICVLPWECPAVDDLNYQALRNSCWKGTDADWVIVADLDELIYFPEGAEKSLGAYTQMGAAVIRPHGFELYSETYPTGNGQIYDEIKQAAPDDKWYAKPILFTPHLVSEIRLGMGSHAADPVLHDQRRFAVGQKWPFAKPPTWLLHCKQIGPVKDIADRYDATRARMCEMNIKMHWGNLEPGEKHVQDKRFGIVPNLRQIIP